MKIIDSLYINGQWQRPHGQGTVQVINPATGEACVTVPKADQADVAAAAAAARRAFPGWSSTPAARRAELILAAAAEMERRYQDLVDAHVETLGCPRHLVGPLHVDGSIEGMRYYARQAHLVEEEEERGPALIVKDPVGVCAFINPWNYPLYQLIGKAAPALAAGCTVMAKPAEQTPLQDVIMAEIFDRIGLPAGVFNLLLGSGREIGPLMSSHPEVDLVSFTGSTAAGIQVATAAAPTVKRVCQELGGKSALIITEDADLAAAVRYGVQDVMANSGQTCNALTRMYLPAGRYQEAVELARAAAEEQKVGSPLDGTVTMGPLVSRRQQQRVREWIEQGIQEGARLVTGGADLPPGLERGAYVRPTIFADVTQNMTIAREEIFGPVLCLLAYDNVERAIEMANDSVYGLAAGVYARDQDSALRIARRLQAGQCSIQGNYAGTQAPFGGYKQSGNGREWGVEGLMEYIETKAIIRG